MRIYVQKPKKEVSLHPGLLTLEARRNQAAREAPHANAEGSTDWARISPRTRFGHDFSQIPVYSGAQIGLQAKLAVDTPGDSYEQEADRFSEQVTTMPGPRLQRSCECGGGCPSCQNQQPPQERLRGLRVQANDSGEKAAPPIVDRVLHSSGQPLDPSTRKFM